MTGRPTRTWKRVLAVAASIALGATIAAAQNSQGASHAVGDASSVPAPANSSVPAASTRPNVDYVIGPGDLLSIDVMNEPDVTGKVPVRPDGMITIPLIGDIKASGLTPDKLQANITSKLTEYVKDPSVTVVVEEMNSRQFNVLGKVLHPGSFPLNKPTRVLDALAQAGGFTEFAKVSKIYVLRRDATGTTTRLPFNYKRVTNGQDDQDDVLLQSGDTVIVP
ncbi:MAG TPA: polysaccharide biosynthesis/export family protein [Candidatus Aquilonibacter sp.]|nr:polysaccharide biosynthesis/export family protein [Candidatus Aquilonibacter sp.]